MLERNKNNFEKEKRADSQKEKRTKEKPETGQKDMALAEHFERVKKGYENDLSQGMMIPLFGFVGNFFKLAWQSVFLKGKKFDEKGKFFMQGMKDGISNLLKAEFNHLGVIGTKLGRTAKGLWKRDSGAKAIF
ncbi:MAG: hypothetical protein NTZ42_04555 [Candidatus Gribaldobacteria bacterium]|nr:hypothetical protein [Candidatus Gribaldobacteria bacterium]